MTATTSIYLPHYHSIKKKRNSRFYYEAAAISSNSEIPLYVTIPVRENVGSLRRSSAASPRNMDLQPKASRKVYRQLSPKNRKKLSSCGSNESMCALLGYIRKKRQSKSSDKLPARRRRSFPKNSRRTSKRATKSRQHKRQKLLREAEIMPSQMLVPRSD